MSMAPAQARELMVFMSAAPAPTPELTFFMTGLRLHLWLLFVFKH